MTYSLKALALVSALTLSACGHYSDDLASLEKDFQTGTPPEQYAINAQGLNTVTPAAGGMVADGAVSFSQSLAQEYYALAKYENDEMYDYRAAKYYTEKASAAVKGEHVPAGYVGEFKIDEESATELRQARPSLIDAMRLEMSPENYGQLARAQAQYDCWLDQAEEQQKTMSCREGFFEALAAVNDPYVEAGRYAVSFDAGTSAFAQGAEVTLQEAVSLIQKNQGKPYRIILSGQGVTADRKLVIQNVLSGQGVSPASVVTASAAGKASKELAGAPERQEDALYLSVKFAEEQAQGLESDI